MRKVTGKFQTKYGTAWYSMTTADAAVVGIEGEWTVSRIPYAGQVELTCKAEKSLVSSHYNTDWRLKHGYDFLRRADGKDKDVLSTSYGNVRNALLECFVNLVTHNTRIVQTAGLLEVVNEGLTLQYKSNEALRKAQEAESAHLAWATKHQHNTAVLKLLESDGDIEI